MQETCSAWEESGRCWLRRIGEKVEEDEKATKARWID